MVKKSVKSSLPRAKNPYLSLGMTKPNMANVLNLNDVPQPGHPSNYLFANDQLKEQIP